MKLYLSQSLYIATLTILSVLGLLFPHNLPLLSILGIVGLVAIYIRVVSTGRCKTPTAARRRPRG